MGQGEERFQHHMVQAPRGKFVGKCMCSYISNQNFLYTSTMGHDWTTSNERDLNRKYHTLNKTEKDED